MVAELGLPIDIVELDTQLFFRESYDTRDRLLERYPVTLVQPQVITVAEQHKQRGPEPLGARSRPLLRDPQGRAAVRALEPYDAWASGIRRDQSPSRADTPKVEWSERYGVWKLHPLADWDEKRVWAYIGSTKFPTTRCTRPGTGRSGASPAPGRRPRRKRSAQAAGPAPTNSSAASIRQTHCNRHRRNK